MPGVTEQAGAQRTEGEAGTDGSTDTGEGTDTPSTQSTASSQSAGSTESTESSGSSGSSGTDQGAAAPAEATTTTTQTRSREQDDPPPSETLTTQTRTPDTGESSPRGREERAPLNVGELVWKVATVLASVVRIVAYVIAVVLVAYVLLTIVGVNPLNAVAQVVGGVANATVLAFRDLFLIADPTFAVVVNYGLAAVFWVLVAEFGSRIIRWLGARFS